MTRATNPCAVVTCSRQERILSPQPDLQNLPHELLPLCSFCVMFHPSAKAARLDWQDMELGWDLLP